MTTKPCRCGHIGEGPHLCHAQGYTCRKPAERRFYDPYNGAAAWSLAGAMPKMSVSETWACDECWADFKTQMAAARTQEKTT